MEFELSDALRQLFPLLLLVHVQCGKCDDSKQQNDYLCKIEDVTQIKDDVTNKENRLKCQII